MMTRSKNSLAKKNKSTSMSEGSKDVSEPQWVLNMHAHFARTGQYRSEDLVRVLGDQRTQVGPRLSVNNLAFTLKK
jgi:DNA replication initiation complex subunit (GINS family)